MLFVINITWIPSVELNAKLLRDIYVMRPVGSWTFLLQ